MSNVFEHDAVPTWSGFIYQGEIALYLALKKICDLLYEESKTKEEIGSNYQVEVEKCEDIAILYSNDNIKEYISIHQVKNQKDTGVANYRSPLVQLMLEKGYYKDKNLGEPEAYLHVSKKINNDTIVQNSENWKNKILEYYDAIKKFISNLEEGNIDTIFSGVGIMVADEPIKFNRASYKYLIDIIKKNCKEENVDELEKELKKLKGFLEEELSVSFIKETVKLYEYEDKKKYCSGPDVFEKIVEQIKRYKNNDKSISQGQYEYIADKLLHNMRQHILTRHKCMQDNAIYTQQILFSEFIDILENTLSYYEEEANILALRRLYEERLSKYCINVCRENCEEKKECKLKKDDFRRVNLEDNDFKKLCYSLNPDCSKSISQRDCISSLLNEDGLTESVFEVLKKVSEKFFIKNNDNTKFMIKNKGENAFLTAISSNNGDLVVQNILGAIENNVDMVSPIFDADQIITSRLEEYKSIWDNDYTDIEEYISSIEDSNENSSCNIKKPEFIRADKIINELSNSYEE